MARVYYWDDIPWKGLEDVIISETEGEKHMMERFTGWDEQVLSETEGEKHMITNDAVNHPKHYDVAGAEVIDIIRDRLEAWDNVEELTLTQAAFYANIVKYVLRAPAKNHIEDMRKAKVYLDWFIEEADSQKL